MAAQRFSKYLEQTRLTVDSGITKHFNTYFFNNSSLPVCEGGTIFLSKVNAKGYLFRQKWYLKA